MGLIFDYAVSNSQGIEKDECKDENECQASVAEFHKRLWQGLRERLDATGSDGNLDGLKLLKGYADILSVITKMERLVWGMEEMRPEKEGYDEYEIAEAMAQITHPQRADKVMDGE